jgi:ribonuclease HII
MKRRERRAPAIRPRSQVFRTSVFGSNRSLYLYCVAQPSRLRVPAASRREVAPGSWHRDDAGTRSRDGCVTWIARPATVPLTRSGRFDKKTAVATERFQFERILLQGGVTRIAGVDEAGRGPLAGPVVAAAVIFPAEWMRKGLAPDLEDLNDSKQLSLLQRERFFAILTTHPEVCFASAIVDVQTIDAINILQATHQAMNEALAQLRPAPEHALVDGLKVRSLRFPQTPLVKGDAKSYSIAAASVIAKVTRDRLMLNYDAQYPAYGFAGHKGYGTPGHLAALAAHGPCPIHRRSFSPIKPAEPELFRL